MGLTRNAIRKSSISPESAEEQLDAFISKFERKHQTLIRSTRRALRRRLPSANEIVYDNYNFFVIGYSLTDRPSDCVVSLVAGSNDVALSFYRGASLPDPEKVLLGAGRQNRFVRLESASTLVRPEIEALIAAALAQGKTPTSVQKRKLIIKSISAKQRPRRNA